MTREQLDELWTWHRADRPWNDLERLHLLQAAERALVLESVLKAAKKYRENYDKRGALLTDVSSYPARKALFAAIDRAEGA